MNEFDSLRDEMIKELYIQLGKMEGKEKAEEWRKRRMNFWKKIYVRHPKHSDGEGFVRIFTDDKITVNKKDIPVLNGTAIIELEKKKLVMENGREKITMDIPKMSMPVNHVIWLWTLQPKYRPGDMIKGFIVSRDRLNPYVMALRKTYLKGCQIRLVQDKDGESGEIIKAIPIDVEGIVQEFEISLEDLKFMKTGIHAIEIANPKGKLLGRARIEISNFQKRELMSIVEKPSWILLGDDLEISVSGKYFHGEMLKSGSVELWGDNITPKIKEFNGKENVVFTFNDLKEGEHMMNVKITDKEGREDETTIITVVSTTPAKFSVTLPDEDCYATLSFKTKIKLENPDHVPIGFTPVTIKWERVSKMESKASDIITRIVETDINGYINFKVEPPHEGSYQLSIETTVGGEIISAINPVVIKRLTEGAIFITNEIEKKKYDEGECIKGKIQIHGLPKTLERITFGYVDLIADKIVETKKIDIVNGKGSYEFNGVVDFWGTIGVDFYINMIQLGISSSITKVDDSFCINKKETATIEPKKPLELSLKVDAPDESRSGEEITIRVKIDSHSLVDDIQVFGALVDQRVITNHSKNRIDKTFLKPPKPMEIIVSKSKPVVISKGSSLGGSSYRGPFRGITSSALPSGMDPRYVDYRSANMRSSMDSQPRFKSSTFSMSSETSHSDSSLFSSSSSYDGELLGSSMDDIEFFTDEMEEIFIETVRENFAESVMICPTKVINDEVEIKVDLPDAITTFDIVLFAASETRFGQEIYPIVVKNPVFTQILNPAEMILSKDMVNIKTIVQNTTNEDIDGAVLMMHGLENIALMEGNGKKTIENIPARGASYIDWLLKGTKVGDAKLIMDLATRNFSERTKLDQPLFIRPPGNAVTEVLNGFVDENTPMNLQWVVKGNEAFVLGKINILPAMEVAIIEGMESLAQYPYGCMEQTVSSTTPNLIVIKYLDASGKLTESTRDTLVNNMQSGFRRMMGYHNGDGGFSYWGGESTPFYTALGLSLIARMKPWLKDVPSDLFERGKEYLIRSKKNRHWGSLGSGHGMLAPRMINSHGITAFVVNSMALGSTRFEDAFSWLVESFDEYKNDPTTLALVLEAWGLEYKENHPNFGEIVKKQLVNSLHRDDGELTYWERGSALTSTVESTARVMIALLKTFPLDGKLFNMLESGMKYILSKRETRGWRSTTDTLFASMAISEIATSRHTDFTLNVIVNGKIHRTERITPENMDWKVHDLRNIFVDDLIDGENDVKIEMTGQGRCHVVTEIERYYLDEEARATEEARITSSLSVEKVVVDQNVELVIEIEPTKRGLESVMVDIPLPSLFHFNKGCVKILNRYFDRVGWDPTRRSIQIFHKKIKEKKRMRIPLQAKFSGECSVEGKAFEMYSDMEIPLPPLKVVVE